MTETTIAQATRVLIEHDAERMECMDHDGLCCPSGDAHNFHNAAVHQVEALHKAGLLRRDTVDDFGLSKVQVTARLDGPTHVLIERAGVPFVDGYVEQLNPRAPQSMPLRIEPPALARPAAEPGPPVAERLRALADHMEPAAPVTATVLRQFAGDVEDLREHTNPEVVDQITDTWPDLAQHYAERERQTRSLLDDIEREYPDVSGVVHSIVGRVRHSMQHPSERTCGGGC